MRRCGGWVVSGELCVSMGVGGGWFLVGRGPRRSWVRPVYLGVGCVSVEHSVEAMGLGYDGVGCRVEVMCGWGRDPRFALEHVELVGAWLIPRAVWFTSPAGWALC